MTRRRLAAPLALVLLLAASGCDITTEEGVDAEFFVGTWTLVAARDGSGDRTAQVDALLDDFRIDFRSDNSFELDADFSALAEAGGASDVTLDGSYAVAAFQGAGVPQTLVLTTPTAAAPLTINVVADDRVEFSAPAAIVTAILGSTASAIGLTGTVVLTVER